VLALFHSGEWLTTKSIQAILPIRYSNLHPIIKKLLSEKVLERRKNPRAYGYEYRLIQAGELRPGEDAITTALKGRFEKVQLRLVAELENRTTQMKLGQLSVESINSMLRACRENIRQIVELETEAPGEALKVVTCLDFDEEGDGGERVDTEVQGDAGASEADVHGS
jgi:predicted transcriptional regulator